MSVTVEKVFVVMLSGAIHLWKWTGGGGGGGGINTFQQMYGMHSAHLSGMRLPSGCGEYSFLKRYLPMLYTLEEAR